MKNSIVKIIGVAATLVVFAVWLQLAVHATTTYQIVTISPPQQLTEEGGVDYFALGATAATVVPRTVQEGAESSYTISFTARKTIPIDGVIEVMFPAGFGFNPTCQTPSAAPENNDINGSASGSVTIGSIACGTLGGGIIVRVAGAPIQIGNQVVFSVRGVVNGSARGISSIGYQSVIVTYNEKHAFLESVVSLPFFLTPAGTQRISGVVFNDNGAGLFGFAGDGVQGGTEPGLAGVGVCLNGKSGSQCITTDTNGYYQFTKLDNGTYGISVTAPSTSGVVGGPFFVDIALSGQDRTGLNFAFQPAKRVITAQIDTIPGGTDVRLFAVGGANGGTSIARIVVWNGQATRTIALPVSDGVWSVGVEPVSVYAAAFIPPAARQVFVDGDAEYRVLLPLKSARVALSGRVVDTVGAGVQGAYVVATPRVFTADVARESVVRTNADGSFALNVAPGRYRVEVSMPGMPAVPGVDVDGAGENIRFVIPKGERAVSGRVLDENGGPLAFAVVSAQEIDSAGRPIGARVEHSTDATGLFVLYVSAGRWRLRAKAPVSGEIPDIVVTILNKDVSNQNMQISVENLGTVKGRITKAGEPVMGAFVTVSNPVNGRTATTDNDGRYAVRVIAGSGYMVEARINGARVVAPIENVTITPGAMLVDQDFAILTTGTLAVTVVGVSGAYVEARDATGNGDATTKNSTLGLYRITVPAGRYTVQAKNTQYGLIGKQAEVAVSAGKETTVSFVPPVPSAVSGKIVSQSSLCVGGVSISVVDVVSGRVFEALTGDDGGYVLSLRDGAYSLTASKKGCIDKPNPIVFAVRGAPISLTERTMTLAEAEVKGTVLLLGKNVALETKVVAESASGIVQSTTVDTTATNGTNFSFNLTAGTWTLTARADGYASSAHAVAIDETGKVMTLILSPIPGYVPVEPRVEPIAPARGGVVKNNDAGERFAIVLPAGALGNSSDSGSVATKVTTAVVTRTATAEVIGGKGIEITLKDSTGRPITSLTATGADASITVPYDAAELAARGISPESLSLAVWSEDKQQWTPFPTTVATVNATLSGAPPHFSVFAPIVPAVSADVVSRALQLVTEETAVPIENQTAPAPVGTVLVRPEEPRLQTIADNKQQQEDAGGQEGVAGRDEKGGARDMDRLVEDTGGSDISIPRTGEDKTPEDRVITAGPTVIEKVMIKKEKVADSVRSDQGESDFIPPTQIIEGGIFEVSLVVDEGSRVVVSEDGTISIRGEIMKSVEQDEMVSVRFMIKGVRGNVVFDQTEEMRSGALASFTKQFKFPDSLADGFYTIALEARYGNQVVSSSDRFEVKRNGKDVVVGQQQPGPSAVPSEDKKERAIAMSALTVLLVLLGAAVWMFMRVMRLFVR